LKICEKGSGGGLLLPLFGDWEQEWPTGLRIVLYLMGLVWLFMGVAIVSDVFMAAIEKITSEKKLVRVSGRACSVADSDEKCVTAKVWNDTVANLTLMALGSSAPEILLSVIDLFKKEFRAGELGPSTIVGSAAFNLLVISAVCVCAIPDGEIRLIKEMNVFFVTASFSIFAYVWLFFCVSIHTDNEVSIGEGVCTLLFLPLLVSLAYAADQGFWMRSAKVPLIQVIDEHTTKEDLAAMQRQVLAEDPATSMTTEELAKRTYDKFKPKPTRATYRIAAVRNVIGTGGVPLLGLRSSLISNATDCSVTVDKTSDKVMSVTDDACGSDPGDTIRRAQCTIEFVSGSFSVMENCRTAHIGIRRVGNVNKRVTVQCRTRPGTAAAWNEAEKTGDYKSLDETLEFLEGESHKSISIDIVNDEEVEGDEDFYVDLLNPSCEDERGCATLGAKATCVVKIVDDDDPGTLQWGSEETWIEQGNEDMPLQLTVERKEGSVGEITVHYFTEDGDAIGGWDFDHVDDVVTMKDQQEEATVTINIKPGRGRYEKKENFRVIMNNPTGGAKINQYTDGGPECNICTVTIRPEERTKERIDRVYSLLKVNIDKTIVGNKNWHTQFKEAISVSTEDDEPPTLADKAMHVATVMWKVLFAFIPPVDYCGGWLCFVCALIMIGCCTALIGDMAELFGCLLDLHDAVTAVTFVALGTSMPDLFASKTAALADPYADASIGNVTGSNSVNVFLGLGLPWVIGSIYWAAKGVASDGGPSDGGKFVVPEGNLGFSLIVYSICATLCISLLMIRRVFLGGELGGPPVPKYASAAVMVSMWFFYVGISSWYVMDNKGACD
jgi:solute carrier family 8 (sodium/calcium exchanger)